MKRSSQTRRTPRKHSGGAVNTRTFSKSTVDSGPPLEYIHSTKRNIAQPCERERPAAAAIARLVGIPSCTGFFHGKHCISSVLKGTRASSNMCRGEDHAAFCAVDVGRSVDPTVASAAELDGVNVCQ